jgi:hypothetical protein
VGDIAERVEASRDSASSAAGSMLSSGVAVPVSVPAGGIEVEDWHRESGWSRQGGAMSASARVGVVSGESFAAVG